MVIRAGSVFKDLCRLKMRMKAITMHASRKCSVKHIRGCKTRSGWFCISTTVSHDQFRRVEILTAKVPRAQPYPTRSSLLLSRIMLRFTEQSVSALDLADGIRSRESVDYRAGSCDELV
jgi:hypothetical protein